MIGNFPIHPRTASNFADQFNLLFLVLLGLSFLFAGGVIFFSIYWSYRYREGSNVPRTRPEHENRKLETLMIGGPLVLGLGIYIWGAVVFANEKTIPKNAIEIFVIGKQWMWHIQHGNGAREMDRLTVPVNHPIVLTMVSQDVIHEFYIPAFRVQYQVVPGRYTSEWFLPNKIGRYVFLCNQYCGTDHSKMWGYVNVVSDADYQRWLKEYQSPGQPTERTLFGQGENLFQSEGCVSCHGTINTPRGPSLVGLFGKQQSLASGATVPVDENFIRAQLVQPENQVASGYTNTMPSYSDLDEQKLYALVVYVKSLQNASQLPSVAPRAPALERRPNGQYP